MPPISLSIRKPVTLCWLRRDLRLHDHHALHKALQGKPPVLLIFIFDLLILRQCSNRSDPRISFIYAALQEIKAKLEKQQSSLLVLLGNPLDLFKELLDHHKVAALHANADYEPYAIDRDRKTAALFEKKGVDYHIHQDQVIFSPNEILSNKKRPYTVYTPYKKAWQARYLASQHGAFSTKEGQQNLLKIAPLPLPSLEEIGFSASTIDFPSKKLDISLIERYGAQRNALDKPSTTRIGIHLRFGTVSIRELTQLAAKHSEVWLSQLIWRNFFMMILYHFPYVTKKAFKAGYEKIPWRQDKADFKAWREGKTGYPIVDAAMVELNTTGFMHNRARMIVASFLTKLLLIDWRWGEAYFAEKLLDYEMASNNGNWQWAAGTGCDAAPYFRIFNPTLQQARFDPTHQYIKKWLPTYQAASYIKPIVDYKFARRRALSLYQSALNQT